VIVTISLYVCSHGPFGDYLVIDVELRLADRLVVLTGTLPDELHAKRLLAGLISLETNFCSGGRPRKL